eukprot:5180969-Pyramimonas_sp.AAC.1
MVGGAALVGALLFGGRQWAVGVGHGVGLLGHWGRLGRRLAWARLAGRWRRRGWVSPSGATANSSVGRSRSWRYLSRVGGLRGCW